MNPVVSVEHLSKSYGRHRAVDDVSFTVERGEVLGLLGPNGSGKSTILRILAGYLNASGGRVRVSGFDVVEQGIEARRRIGYVPEDAPLYDHMRVEESLDFMGRLRGLRGDALSSAVESSCARLSLDAVRGRAVGALSRGYRQRVAIAQALLDEPDLLVLDEPTNGLDPRQIIDLRELIRDLASRHTLLVTSHILAEMERLATRVAILLDGRLLAMHHLERHGVRRVRLRVRSANPSALLAVLAEVPGVAAVHAPESTGDDMLRAVLDVEGLQAVERLAPALVAAGVPLVEMADVSTELESLFLSLTEGARA